MKNKIFPVLAFLVLAAGIFPRESKAALNYGSGYYTNLCGTGTAATGYTCSSGCNPATGSCTVTNNGAVRYVCRGNWNQCLENEAGWVNGVAVGEPGCDNTVQLSIYDHQCRRDDGSWDGSCQLLGYMVWYSGDCRPGVAGYATGVPLAPTSTPTPTVVSKFSSPTPVNRTPTPPTPTPTVTIKVSPTLTKTQGVCNRTCNTDSDCTTGLFCENKVCRNRDCPLDKTCFCSTTAATSSAKPINTGTTSPETGMPIWLLGLGIMTLGYLGLKVVHIGRMLWS